MLAPLIPVPLSVVAEDPSTLENLPTRLAFVVFNTSDLDLSPTFDHTAQTAPGGLLGDDDKDSLTRNLVAVAIDARAGRVILGRSRGRSHVVVSDRRVSGAHAAIAWTDDEKWWLSDLSSSNGTFLDDRCLAPGDVGRVMLRPGATFALAHIGIRFFDAATLRSWLAPDFTPDRSRP